MAYGRESINVIPKETFGRDFVSTGLFAFMPVLQPMQDAYAGEQTSESPQQKAQWRFHGEQQGDWGIANPGQDGVDLRFTDNPTMPEAPDLSKDSCASVHQFKVESLLRTAILDPSANLR